MIRHAAFALAVAVAVALAPALHAYAMSCSIDSITAVAFGAYDVFDGSPTDSTGSITYQCTGVATSDTVTIDLDSGNATGFFPRELDKGVDTIDYNLYLDASRTTVWGDGTGGTGHYQLVEPPEGTPVAVTVYGRIPALQMSSAGTYTDTIVATVIF